MHFINKLKEKKFKYLEGFDKPNHFELSQTQRISFKSELVEKKASLSISDTNSLNFAPIVKDESNDRISDCSEIEEFDVKVVSFSFSFNSVQFIEISSLVKRFYSCASQDLSSRCVHSS